MYTKLEKDKLISGEEARLSRIYKNLSKDKMALSIGLIQRLAFLRISMQELETDLNENGYTEKFSQGDQEPYDRKRPNADIYVSFYANYLKTTKQLADMQPKAEVKANVSDGFDEFISGRDEI